MTNRYRPASYVLVLISLLAFSRCALYESILPDPKQKLKEKLKTEVGPARTQYMSIRDREFVTIEQCANEIQKFNSKLVEIKTTHPNVYVKSEAGYYCDFDQSGHFHGGGAAVFDLKNFSETEIPSLLKTFENILNSSFQIYFVSVKSIDIIPTLSIRSKKPIYEMVGAETTSVNNISEYEKIISQIGTLEKTSASDIENIILEVMGKGNEPAIRESSSADAEEVSLCFRPTYHLENSESVKASSYSCKALNCTRRPCPFKNG